MAGTYPKVGRLRATLRSRRHRRLQVVLVEVALEVEVGELLALRHAQQLLERRIRLDVVLVLEVVLLDVVVHRLRDLRARHQRAVALAEEVAEVVGDGRRALEDGRRTLDLNTVLVRLDAALALARILDLAVDTLLQALDLAQEGGDRLTHRREVASHRLDVLLERRGRRSGSRRLSGRRRDRRNDNRRSDRRRRRHSGRLSLRRLLGDDLLLGDNRHQRRNRRLNNHRDGGLRGNDLLSDLRGGSRAHNTSSRGIRRRHFTHYLLPGVVSASIFGVLC